MARPHPTPASTSASAYTTTAAATVTSSSANAPLKQRVPHSCRTGQGESTEKPESMHDEEEIPMADGPLLVAGGSTDPHVVPPPATARNQWILFALASGACAAFNGVFAKL